MKNNQKRKRRQTKKGFSVSHTEAFKYIVAFAFLVYVVLLLMYTSGSTKSFEEVAEGIESGIITENLVKQNTQALKRYYGLNSADYDGVLLYTSQDSISAEEILMVKTKTDRQVQKIRDAIQVRLDQRENNFENMAPNQLKILDKAQILVRGRFVFFVISEDAQEYSALFTKSL